ncbi:7TM-DISM domain-containing protein [Oceanicoccus sp. KOV_DT_Chl]|uniref:sensor histidine kinase n=1 Tax=Oceanicoccus sp. KOV_DT_Chl TaxID=1904639 RepID=UPI001358900A|nr:7TM-DISM domain-containing protein [Oceanicoccus sp. KOV_DT_Chl]
MQSSNAIEVYQQSGWLFEEDTPLGPAELLTKPALFKPFNTLNNPFSLENRAYINNQPAGIWLHIPLQNTSADTIALTLYGRESVELGKLAIYRSSGNTTTTLKMTRLPQQRYAYSVSFELAANSNETLLIYWPGQINPSTLKHFKLLTNDDYQQDIIKHFAIAYLTTGMALALALYNLSLFIYTREKPYFNYACYVIFAGIFFSLHDEIGFQVLEHFSFSAELMSKFLWWSYMPGIIGLMLFSREFLQSRIYQPRLDKVILLLIAIAVFISLFGLALEQSLIRDASTLTVSFIYPALLILGIRAWINGQAQSKIYVIAFLCYLSMALLGALAIVIGNDTDAASEYVELTRIGLMANLFLLSIALADRIQTMKQLQSEAIAEANAAKESSDLKGQFLANMSHELRTPINGIIGMGQIIKENAKNANEENNANILLNSADNLLNVVNDILDFSKIEAGKLRIQNESFAISQVLTQLGTIFFGINDHPAIKFSIKVDGNLATFLIGDQQRLIQVLNNLLSNAFKFTSQGNITLNCTCLETNDREQTIRFSVIDSGIGISEKDLENLFEAYEQADKSSTRQQGGTGLGLTITKQLIELMNGTIGVNSEPGKGSEFWFILTLAIDQQQQKLLQQQRQQLKGKRIAIIFADQTFGQNEFGRCIAIGMQPSLYIYDEKSAELPTIAQDNFDVVFSSDSIGSMLIKVVQQCAETQTALVIARTGRGYFEDQWLQQTNIQILNIPATTLTLENTITTALSCNILVTDHDKNLIPNSHPPTPINILVGRGQPY